jgi:hypothetical protein
MPKLCDWIPTDVVQLSDPLSVFFDEPAEAPSMVRLFSRPVLSIENGWQFEHAIERIPPGDPQPPRQSTVLSKTDAFNRPARC